MYIYTSKLFIIKTHTIHNVLLCKFNIVGRSAGSNKSSLIVNMIINNAQQCMHV